MSAIFGIWNTNGASVNTAELEIMKEELKHYGRDDEGVFIAENLAIGSFLQHLRLDSTDDSPFYNHNPFTIVTDAQVYNRDELIDLLALENSVTTQQLLLEAYEKWGLDCPKYVNGDFAFAVWNQQLNELTIVRDHLGVRPLYYTLEQGIFAFASDYRALLSLPFVKKQINSSVLYKLLSNQNYYPPDKTFFKGIHKLPAAHVMTVRPEQLVKHKYWTPGAQGNIRYPSDKEYFSKMEELVHDAISRRIQGVRGQVGAELSGGLDSSVITVIAHRDLQKQKKSLSLYSWSPSYKHMPKQPRDERVFIEDICKQEGLTCTYYDMERELQSPFLVAIQPVDTQASFPLGQGAKELSEKGVRVVLTGWGGDQGVSHRATFFELFNRREFRPFVQEVWRQSQGSWIRFSKKTLSHTLFKWYKLYRQQAKFGRSPGLIVQEAFHDAMNKDQRGEFIFFNINPVKHIESGNIQTRTELTAWVGADYGVQYVYPFLDFRLVDFAMSIPAHMFYKKGISRYIYRKTFEHLLPKELCYYTEKDDIARVTHLLDMREQANLEEIILKEKLDRHLFGDYIDFSKAEQWLQDQSKEHTREKTSVRRQLNFLYNIQKLLDYAKKKGIRGREA